MTAVDAQAQAREEVLDMLEEKRSVLVARAQVIAMDLWRKRGEVSATDVWYVMQKEASGAVRALLVATDPRWMGAVFRAGWRRLRWEATGSHKRPVAVWTRAESES